MSKSHPRPMHSVAYNKTKKFLVSPYTPEANNMLFKHVITDGCLSKRVERTELIKCAKKLINVN